MDTKTFNIIYLNSIAVIYIHFYKTEYKYYNVNIKSFNLSKLINLLLSIIRDIINIGSDKLKKELKNFMTNCIEQNRFLIRKLSELEKNIY